MPVSVELDDHVRKQIVLARLQEFYRTTDPRQLPLVENTFIEHANNIEGLFDELLRKYPRTPSNAFDEVLSTLRGLSHAASLQQAHRKADATTQSKKTQVHDLLSEGAQLLAAPVPKGFYPAASSLTADGEDDTQSRHSGFSQSFYSSAPGSVGGNEDNDDDDLNATSQGHLDDIRTLRALIAENQELARQVAICEQQVLQKRFEVLFVKLVENGNASGTTSPAASSRGVDAAVGGEGIHGGTAATTTTMVIYDKTRAFHVACTPAEVLYVQQGPLAAPWSLSEDDHCFVQFHRAADANKRGSTPSTATMPKEDDEIPRDTNKVMRTVLSMALRVWARRAPHSVTERHPGGEVTVHPSTVLWWQWPSACEQHQGIAPRSLTHVQQQQRGGGAEDLDGWVPPSPHLLEQNRQQRRSAPLHETICHLLADTPSSRYASGDRKPVDDGSPLSGEQRDDAFWARFLQQYNELSKGSARATDQV